MRPGLLAATLALLSASALPARADEPAPARAEGVPAERKADPQTAIGIAAARARPCAGGVPIIAMATAHPAKFPDAMERATGHRPALPPRMADLFERQERFTVLPNDLGAVEASVRALVGRNSG